MSDVIVRQIEPGGQKWFSAQRFAKGPLRCEVDAQPMVIESPGVPDLILYDATGVPYKIPFRGRIEITLAESNSGPEVADA